MPAQGLATFTILRRRSDCGLRNCVIVRQSVSPNNFRKANASITVMDLHSNKIGDKGATALAECLTATLVTCFFRCAWHCVSAHSEETFCHLSRNSVGMLFCQTHWCRSVWVAWRVAA